MHEIYQMKSPTKRRLSVCRNNNAFGLGFVCQATKHQNKCKLELQVCPRVKIWKCPSSLNAVIRHCWAAWGIVCASRCHRAPSQPNKYSISTWSDTDWYIVESPVQKASIFPAQGDAVAVIGAWQSGVSKLVDCVYINVHKYGDGGSRHRVVEARGADR